MHPPLNGSSCLGVVARIGAHAWGKLQVNPVAVGHPTRPREDASKPPVQALSAVYLLDELADLVLHRPERVPRAIRRVVSDSRQVRPGDVFVAVRGNRADGHEFLAESVERGASLLVVQADRLGRDSGYAEQSVFVRNSRLALSRLAAAAHRYPARRLTMAGITGTNGKTTAVDMTARILERAGFQVGRIGTLGAQFAGQSHPLGLTTPDAPLLHRLLGQMVDAGVGHVVMEVSSHALAQYRVADVPFAAAALTNISLDHPDYHHSLHDYVGIKSRLFSTLKAGATAVLPLGEPWALEMAGRTQARILWVGRNSDHVGGNPLPSLWAHQLPSGPDCEFRLGVEADLEGTNPVATGSPVSYRVRLRTAGEHNIDNALIAAGTARALGVAPEVIARGLQGYEGVSRRLSIRSYGRLTVVDDFAHNPAGIDAAFAMLEGQPHLLPPTRDLIVVVAVRGSRSATINRANAGRVAAGMRRMRLDPDSRRVELIVTLSRDSVGHKDWVHPEEESAFMEGLGGEGRSARVLPTLSGALKESLDRARPDGVILLLGAQGMDGASAILDRLIREAGLPPAGAGNRGDACGSRGEV